MTSDPRDSNTPNSAAPAQEVGLPDASSKDIYKTEKVTRSERRWVLRDGQLMFYRPSNRSLIAREQVRVVTTTIRATGWADV